MKFIGILFLFYTQMALSDNSSVKLGEIENTVAGKKKAIQTKLVLSGDALSQYFAFKVLQKALDFELDDERNPEVLRTSGLEKLLAQKYLGQLSYRLCQILHSCCHRLRHQWGQR